MLPYVTDIQTPLYIAFHKSVYIQTVDGNRIMGALSVSTCDSHVLQLARAV